MLAPTARTRIERENLFDAHVPGMAFEMKKDETFDPIDVGVFGAARVIPREASHCLRRQASLT